MGLSLTPCGSILCQYIPEAGAGSTVGTVGFGVVLFSTGFPSSSDFFEFVFSLAVGAIWFVLEDVEPFRELVPAFAMAVFIGGS